ncbi:1-deoxy-D-xylulose-5-phosphate synthase [Corallococcus exiguus]|uniref:1-deoxy-D-xylulose-5-phosphate synthase n=1 Tax=Corallococcus TaxID=83461 RepID=UPI000EA3222A|nr:MULTISPECIES: 1-deoxy-D-xylulose-5-phosphate synthase [Corallococcus]NRD64623.1 1-deoxy-D-xylulose-5-phosphate synthase [Corallococcus exiguus]RKH20791.1 1-deoxy-D-xylulose-5-phosphate synthase [Corallococcus sp. CA041A]RKI18836.1 1-deoxy-D-xylulose-5-phosphate synthase [Corallococcus sp. AB030]RUO88571.1 1-deoxy-D-xylulose-5-phosphate synthase [Corallococcus sp. AB018]
MADVLSGVASPADVRALPEDALPGLCEALREAIITTCGRVGGHLGASLGAVEVVVALHRVFHTPQDALLFDVGHQAYAHKLLTGRRDRMHTLRQADGIAPFLDPRESHHDALAAGHACTAISAALGLLAGRRQLGHSGHVVAVVGDGALTGGLSFEGLNNAGGSPLPLVVVLNDNQMSISANVGAIPALLRTRNARAFFESLGFTYLGPVDGHDLGALTRALREAKASSRPVVVHALTKKGRGFPPAEADEQTRGHAMGPYEWRDGKLVRSRGGRPTFSEAFAQVLGDALERDPRVVAVTPAMLEGSALTGLKARFPDRVHDVGIAEQHAVTFCAGLAAAGAKPVCVIYSTFLQRAYDQVVHDVCLPGLPVVFAVDRAGLVGADGATHQGAYDVSFLRPLPGLTQWAPVVGEDLGPMLATALQASGPSVLRFPRGTLPDLPPELARDGTEAHDARAGAEGGKSSTASRLTPAALPMPGARWLKRVPGSRLTLVTLGPLGLSALEAVRSEPDWSALDARRAWPLDEAALLEAAAGGHVVVAEEGTVRGGLGSAVLELYAASGVSPRVTLLGMPDVFLPHGDARVQRTQLGLDAAGLLRAGRALLGEENR